MMPLTPTAASAASGSWPAWRAASALAALAASGEATLPGASREDAQLRKRSYSSSSASVRKRWVAVIMA